MAIKFAGRYNSYNYKEQANMWASSLTDIDDLDNWTVYRKTTYTSSPHTASTNQYKAGGWFSDYTGQAAYGGYYTKIFNTDNLNQGNNFIHFSFHGSAITLTNSTYTQDRRGQVFLYICDDISGIANTAASTVPTNSLLLASNLSNNKKISSSNNGNSNSCAGANFVIQIEDSQFTVYRDGYNQTGPNNASSSLVADATTQSTAGWSGELYLYVLTYCSDYSNRPTLLPRPDAHMTPIILSNKPIGGQGTV